MQFLKYFILFIILSSCSLLGRFLSKKYVIRVNQIEEMKNALYMLIIGTSTGLGMVLSQKYISRVNELKDLKSALVLLKTKIRYTYEPIPEIFKEIAQNVNIGIGQIFESAIEKMNTNNANVAWEEAIEESNTYFSKEDKQVIKTLSKLLGQTDTEGQISQIEITQEFLETQLKQAQEEREKNEKLYNKLGTTIGLAIVIILC